MIKYAYFLSQINRPRQLLNLIEQVVTLFKRPLVQLVPLVRWISLNNPRNFVNFARQSPRPNQLRKFPVDEINRNPKLIGHR